MEHCTIPFSNSWCPHPMDVTSGTSVRTNSVCVVSGVDNGLKAVISKMWETRCLNGVGAVMTPALTYIVNQRIGNVRKHIKETKDAYEARAISKYAYTTPNTCIGKRNGANTTTTTTTNTICITAIPVNINCGIASRLTTRT